MAASSGPVRVRCQQCVGVFMSVEEFAQHACAQQQSIQQSERVEQAQDNNNWATAPQDNVTAVDHSLINMVQNEMQNNQRSDPNVVGLPENGLVIDRSQSAFHTDVSGIVANGVESRNPVTAYSHWSREATLLLIKLFRENEASFSLGNRKKKLVWQDITDTLRQHGHNFTRYQVEGRWKTLTAAYRRTVQHNMTSIDQRDWPFFKELSEIFTVRRLTSYAINESSSCNGYSGCSMRCSKIGKSRRSNQLDVIEWLCKYEQRHEQRTQSFFDRIERMHREKLNALRELVDIMRRLKR